jgi:hypothetical protein
MTEKIQQNALENHIIVKDEGKGLAKSSDTHTYAIKHNGKGHISCLSDY